MLRYFYHDHIIYAVWWATTGLAVAGAYWLAYLLICRL